MTLNDFTDVKRGKTDQMIGVEDQVQVLVMGNFPYPHGMAGTKRVQHLIDGLVACGFGVQVLLIRQAERALKRNKVIEKGIYKGVPFQTIGNDLKVDALFPVRVIRFIKDGFRALRQLKGNGKNVIYYYGTLNLDNLIFIWVAKRMGYKIIFDIVEDNQLIAGKVSFKRKVNLFITQKLDALNLKWSDGLVVISRHLQEKYAAINQWNRPIVLIPISARLNPIIPKSELNDPVRIIYAGSFSRKDGVDVLIEAVKKIGDRHPVKLFLVGRGKGVSYYQKTYGNIPQIEFTGYLSDEDYYHLLQSGDIMCVPRTNSEYAHAGFPFKLGEYLATGNPVITSNTGDIEDYLTDKQDAVLTEPGDADALAEAISFLISEPRDAVRIGQRGREICREKFSPEKNTRLLVNLIQKLFSKEHEKHIQE